MEHKPPLHTATVGFRTQTQTLRKISPIETGDTGSRGAPSCNATESALGDSREPGQAARAPGSFPLSAPLQIRLPVCDHPYHQDSCCSWIFRRRCHFSNGNCFATKTQLFHQPSSRMFKNIHVSHDLSYKTFTH